MVTSEPTYQGPDNHADWCHTQHDGFCVDELLAAIDRKRQPTVQQDDVRGHRRRPGTPPVHPVHPRRGVFPVSVERVDTIRAELEAPNLVVLHLQQARVALSQAHAAASEVEDRRRGLNGSVRDLIFGLNTAVDSLVSMVDEGRFGEQRWGLFGKPHKFTATTQTTCTHLKWPNDSIDAPCGMPKEHPIHV